VEVGEGVLVVVWAIKGRDVGEAKRGKEVMVVVSVTEVVTWDDEWDSREDCCSGAASTDDRRSDGCTASCDNRLSASRRWKPSKSTSRWREVTTWPVKKTKGCERTHQHKTAAV
jgi:hypothetical protein